MRAESVHDPVFYFKLEAPPLGLPVPVALDDLETQEILYDFAKQKVMLGDLTQSLLTALSHGR